MFLSRWQSFTYYSPKRELANPYHMQPPSPISHLPCRLAAKLNGVPNTHTRMSLRLMFSRMRLMGVHKERYLTKRRRTRELLRMPATRMTPRSTATAVWLLRLSPPGHWGSQGPLASMLGPKMETELSGVLKLQSRGWTTISEGRREQRVAVQQQLCTSAEVEGWEHLWTSPKI